MPEQNSSCPSPSIMTVSPCMTRSCPSGAPSRWGPSETSWVNWLRPFVGTGWSLRPRHTGRNTSGSLTGDRKFESDVQDPAFDGLYGPAQPAAQDGHSLTEAPPTDEFLQDWLARTCELVDKYRPQIVWFDWWIQQEAFAPYLQKFAAYYYNRAAEWGVGVAINYKYEAFAEGTAVFDVERGQLSGIRPLLWQNDTAVGKNSWGYIQNMGLQGAGRTDPGPGGHRQQERRAAAQHRPAPRWHYPRRGPGDPARDRWVAPCERGRDLRHTPLEGLWRGPDTDPRGRVHRHPAHPVHGRGHPVHHPGRHALCHRARLAPARR